VALALAAVHMSLFSTSANTKVYRCVPCHNYHNVPRPFALRLYTVAMLVLSFVIEDVPAVAGIVNECRTLWFLLYF